jgi:hypothetical protein
MQSFMPFMMKIFSFHFHSGFRTVCYVCIKRKHNTQTKKGVKMKIINLAKASLLVILAALMIAVAPAQSTVYAKEHSHISKQHHTGKHKKHKKHKKSGKKKTTNKENKTEKTDKNKTNNNGTQNKK